MVHIFHFSRATTWRLNFSPYKMSQVFLRRIVFFFCSEWFSSDSFHRFLECFISHLCLSSKFCKRISFIISWKFIIKTLQSYRTHYCNVNIQIFSRFKSVASYKSFHLERISGSDNIIGPFPLKCMSTAPCSI